MKPGRELDALVAEKVMGWKPLLGPSKEMDEGFKERYWEYARNHALRLTPESSFLPGLEHPVPPYSTDIGAVWEVVEKLGLAFELGWLPEDKGFNWDASFGEKRGSEAGTTTYASTAPHAICLAALKAVRVPA